jgi:hypothetical protein
MKLSSPLFKRVKNEVRLILYNYTSKDILGYATFMKEKGRNYWVMDRDAAEKGYGPLMYDLALQSVYPEYIKPSKLIKEEAVNVWNFYYNHRDDVDKAVIPEHDPNYLEEFDYGVNRTGLKDPKVLDVINSIYSLKKSPEYNIFVQNGVYAINKYNLNVEKTFKRALDYFYDKYYQ